MLLALAVDAVLGWPSPIHAWIGHPVTWIGALIAALGCNAVLLAMAFGAVLLLPRRRATAA